MVYSICQHILAQVHYPSLRIHSLFSLIIGQKGLIETQYYKVILDGVDFFMENKSFTHFLVEQCVFFP
jgi:hypothetical protein